MFKNHGANIARCAEQEACDVGIFLCDLALALASDNYIPKLCICLENRLGGLDRFRLQRHADALGYKI
jgi:hypothetical protein